MKCVLTTIVLSLCAANVHADFIRYDVSRTIGLGTVTGFIQTDGILGVLSKDNIKSWSLTLAAPNLKLAEGQLSDTITSASGNAFLVGNAVTASPTELMFDFNANGTNYLFFTGSSANFWCLETRICIDDGIDRAEEIGHNNLSGSVAQLENRTGTIVFASVAAVPVPAAVWLFASGLLWLAGFARWKR